MQTSWNRNVPREYASATLSKNISETNNAKATVIALTPLQMNRCNGVLSIPSKRITWDCQIFAKRGYDTALVLSSESDEGGDRGKTF